ncbi:MAG: glycine cleavage system protein GcvH [Endomicrobium sp.]|jgi:glycine cleavage system H protein|nr:glycine cleavage system protein GcvH [Endomicrobium sp.]
MNIPNDLRYTKTHEWVKINEQEVTVGITDFAQQEITDIVHVELPDLGKHVNINQPVAIIESVKSAFDIYAPLSGEIIKINTLILEKPELINKFPYLDGYLFKLKIANINDLNVLLSVNDYQKLVTER